jgi:hypothetical protein
MREEDKSSPRRHCPQKATLAMAATAASRGSWRSRAPTRDVNIVVLTGGRGRRREESGMRFLTLFRMKLSRNPPFHLTLCRMCQALRAEMYLHTVFPDIWPALEAAKAQRTNSLAGKRSSEGMFSWLQKLRKRVRAKEYPAIVEAERLFWRVLSNKLSVLAENEGPMGLGGSKKGRLKRSSLRAWALVKRGLEGNILGCFFGLLLVEAKGSPHM